MTKYQYQVGGSLKIDSPTYVARKADNELYNALIEGEFCYVLTSRQMGKSSLKVQVKNRLQKEGIACASIDMTRIGSEQITAEQWYKGIALDLLRGLKIFKQIKFKEWWEERKDISRVQRFIFLIEELVFSNIENQKIVIFIDEIDSVISLPFPSDDLFALIRSCYDRRAENKEYDRLSFALFGVATPGDLIRDRNRTPFNIGTAIYLSGFKLAEAKPLVKGLENIFSQPEKILSEILSWTGGQPFLTQKVCNLLIKEKTEIKNDISLFVEEMVRKNLVENWESKDEPEHLKTIRDRILAKEEKASKLLVIYQKALNKGAIAATDSSQQEQLLLSGLVIKEKGYLQVYNRIYREVFNKQWVREQLNNLRPYARSLNDWLTSRRKDRSRLLRGNSLELARKWAIEKSLSDIDYQYLAASEELERLEKQQILEAQRLKAVEARLAIEAKSVHIQRRFLAAVSIALVIASGLGIATFFQYRQATLREIQALGRSSSSLFRSDRQLEALIAAIKAKRKLENYGKVDPQTREIVDEALGKSIYGSFEFNRLSGHTDGIWEVDFSPDSKIIATASWDKTVKLWKTDGSLIRTIKGHTERVFSARFAPDGKKIASGSSDGTIKLWTKDGKLIRTIDANLPVYSVNFSPDGKYIAAAAGNQIQLWDLSGKLLKTFRGHTDEVYKIFYAFNGKYIASGSKDTTVKIWDVETGNELRTLKGHTGAVWEVEFSLDNKQLLSASEDKTIKQWTVDGESIRTIQAHDSGVLDAEYSLDGKRILSVGDDYNIKIWLLDGTLMFTLKGHTDGILDVNYSYDGKTIASSSWDRTVKLWGGNELFSTRVKGHKASVTGLDFARNDTLLVTASRDNTAKTWNLDGELINIFRGHNDGIVNLSISPDRNTVATVSMDRTLKIWTVDGTLINVSSGHTDWIPSVNWSPDGQYIGTASWDRTIKLWDKKGELINTFTGHKNGVLDLDFSPDSKIIASASQDKTIKLWDIDGNLLNTLKGHKLTVRTVAIDPQGEFIISGSRDETVKIWNMEGELLKTLTDHDERIWEVDFSPDGEIFATASDDKTIKLWDRKGDLLQTIYVEHFIRSMAFSSDGKMLAVGDRNMTTTIWNVKNVLELNKLQYACNWVRNYLKNNSEVNSSDRKLCE